MEPFHELFEINGPAIVVVHDAENPEEKKVDCKEKSYKDQRGREIGQ